MAGYDKQCYEIDGVEWPRASTIVKQLYPFESGQYAANCTGSHIRASLAAGVPVEEAIDKAVNGGWEEHSKLAIDIGSTVHDMIERGGMGPIDPTGDEQVDAAIKSWVAWRDANVESILAAEVRLVSKRLGYAGTCDAQLKLKNGQIVLADYKTASGIYPNYGFQLALYREAWDEMGLSPHNCTCLCIRVPKDGKPVETKKYDLDYLHRMAKVAEHVCAAYYLSAKRRLKNNPRVAEFWGGK